jgi:hypothetical protein
VEDWKVTKLNCGLLFSLYEGNFLLRLAVYNLLFITYKYITKERSVLMDDLKKIKKFLVYIYKELSFLNYMVKIL